MRLHLVTAACAIALCSTPAAAQTSDLARSIVGLIGNAVATSKQRKNCQLTLELQYPGGFQYSILSADYRGYANIEKGVTGTLKSTYYFAGLKPQVSIAPSKSYTKMLTLHRLARSTPSMAQ